MQYRVKFRRYDNKRGEVRLSGIHFMNAEDMNDAAAKSDMMVRAMGEADPEREYSVAEIAYEHRNARAIDCDGGGRLFETAEEFSARVNAKKEEAA
jgi:hypothetical protein